MANDRAGTGKKKTSTVTCSGLAREKTKEVYGSKQESMISFLEWCRHFQVATYDKLSN